MCFFTSLCDVLFFFWTVYWEEVKAWLLKKRISFFITLCDFIHIFRGRMLLKSNLGGIKKKRRFGSSEPSNFKSMKKLELYWQNLSETDKEDLLHLLVFGFAMVLVFGILE